MAILHSYIAIQFCGGNRDLVLTDSVNDNSRTRPPSIESYVPDAYVMLDELSKVIIGEAKSLRDLENYHTEAQLSGILEKMQFDGRLNPHTGSAMAHRETRQEQYSPSFRSGRNHPTSKP